MRYRYMIESAEALQFSGTAPLFPHPGEKFTCAQHETHRKATTTKRRITFILKQCSKSDYVLATSRSCTKKLSHRLVAVLS